MLPVAKREEKCLIKLDFNPLEALDLEDKLQTFILYGSALYLRRNIYSRFSSNYVAFASGLLLNVEEMFEVNIFSVVI